MTTIETLTGDCNLRNGSAKCHVFHSPRAGGNGAEERFLGLAAKSGQTAEIIRTVSPFPLVTPSVQGYSPDIGGKMIAMTYQVEDGEILKLFVQRRPGAGKLPVSACRFIRVRESAALRRIEMKLLTDASVFKPYGHVVGRFDLLTVEEAKAAGVGINPAFEKFFGEGVVAATMSDSIIAAETIKMLHVAKADGSTLAIPQEKRRRSLNLHKPSP